MIIIGADYHGKERFLPKLSTGCRHAFGREKPTSQVWPALGPYPPIKGCVTSNGLPSRRNDLYA
jgi:hypothetical protein